MHHLEITKLAETSTRPNRHFSEEKEPIVRRNNGSSKLINAENVFRCLSCEANRTRQIDSLAKRRRIEASRLRVLFIFFRYYENDVEFCIYEQYHSTSPLLWLFFPLLLLPILFGVLCGQRTWNWCHCTTNSTRAKPTTINRSEFSAQKFQKSSSAQAGATRMVVVLVLYYVM